MSELSTVARKLVEEAKSLSDAFDDPPSRTQIEALQAALMSLSFALTAFARIVVAAVVICQFLAGLDALYPDTS